MYSEFYWSRDIQSNIKNRNNKSTNVASTSILFCIHIANILSTESRKLRMQNDLFVPEIISYNDSVVPF